MRIGILCIGDELLKGAVTNTNLAFMGQKLLEHGMIPELCMEIPDRHEEILNTLDYAFSCCDFLITSGGLGPTADDLTKQSIARYFGRTLLKNDALEKKLCAKWQLSHKEPYPSRYLNQTLVPQNAEILQNDWGTAPGLFIQAAGTEPHSGKKIILLPGPPQELCPMFEKEVIPLLEKYSDEKVSAKLFHLAGIGEGFAEERMQKILQKLPGLSVAYCASPEFVKLFLTGDARTVFQAEQLVRKEFAGELLHEECRSLAQEVLMLLMQHNETVSTAESCTGGSIAKLLTDIPGASAAFPGGVVSYANHIKEKILGVRKETLDHAGAVSRECAAEMLDGIMERFGTDCGISVTGIAGPDGGTALKPVGLVYIGTGRGTKRLISECHFQGSREQIRARSAAFALNMLRKLLREEKIS